MIKYMSGYLPALNRKQQLLVAIVALLGWIVFVYATLPVHNRLMLDFTQYYDAGRALLGNTSPYRPEARQFSTAAFLLPPIFAMLVMPIAMLPVYIANLVWYILSIVFLLIGCWSVRSILEDDYPQLYGFRYAAILIIAVLLLPVWTGAKLGQITALLFCLSMVGLALQKSGRPILGGIFLGFAIAFKFIPITVAAFAFWVGWRRFAVASLITFVVLQLISALIYPAIFLEYWQNTIFTIPAISQDVNLSLIGMASRLPREFANVLRPFAYLVSGLMLLLPFLLTWKNQDNEIRLIALALLVSATVTAVPLVEHHYLIWLIFPIWILLCISIQRQDFVRLVLLAVNFILLSQPYRLSRMLLALFGAGFDAEAMGETVLTFGAVFLYILVLSLFLKPYTSSRKATAIAT